MKATQGFYTVQANRQIADKVFEMRLLGPTQAIVQPGQFINIRLNGYYLRRPISVCSWDEQGINIIYKILGRGTADLATYTPGTVLDVLVGLGNGFSVTPAAGKKVALVGGGVGVPPLYGLAKALLQNGQPAPLVVLGFASKTDAFYYNEFAALGCEVLLATENGSLGTKGFVTGPLAQADYTYYYSCGPNAMLQAVYNVSRQKGIDGQLSFEERMGCGFGACMGCSCKTKLGNKRVCVDGPVFLSQEVLLNA